MGVVAEVERKLAKKRCLLEADGMPELRTSTMTPSSGAADVGLPREARAGSPSGTSRTILLVPLAGRRSSVEADATVRDFELPGGREVLSEVIELRLRGDAANHPASVVLPLLISDLPAFCRWRGQPDWSSPRSRKLVDVCDRLVVHSDGGAMCRPATRRSRACSSAAVTDIAWRRSLPWRAQLAALARDPLDRAPDRRRPEGRRAAPGRLAPLAPQARRRAHAALRRSHHVDPGRRRPGRAAARQAAVRERPPVGRARHARRDQVYEAAAKAARPLTPDPRDGLEQHGVKVPVRGDRAAAVDAVLAGEVGEDPLGLDDHLHRGEVHTDTPIASIAPSTAPSATSMWLQKSRSRARARLARRGSAASAPARS